MSETESSALRRQIAELYEAFNRRDIDAVLGGLATDVMWANGMEGGHVHGHDGVRDYWTRQFTQVRSTVQPESVERQADGRVAVQVHQVVHSVDGAELLADTHVRHVFTMSEGLISRFDIE